MSLCWWVCEAHRSVDVHDHLSPGLVAFSVVGSFLFLLQHTVARGPVLQRKLAEDFTEPVDADVPHAVGRMTEVQQERVEPGRTQRTWKMLEKCLEGWDNGRISHPPVDNPAVNDFEDDDPLGAVFQEVRHLLLQLGLHLVLGDDLQVVPWGFAAPLHLTQILLQLVEIHLMAKEEIKGRHLTALLSLFHRLMDLKTRFRISHLCGPRNGPNLRVEVWALREVLNHHRADVMQQGLLVNRVLHLRNLLQICQLEAFSLNTQQHKVFTNEVTFFLFNFLTLNSRQSESKIKYMNRRWV